MVLLTETPAPLTIVEKLEQLGHEALDAVEHAAVWLVGTVAKGEQSLATLAAESPLLQAAWRAGVASATAHGVPVAAIENVGSVILEAARQFADGLAQPAPVKPPLGAKEA
jgi:hypothetical protein